MRKLLLVVSLSLAVACGFGQVITTEHGAQSDVTYTKLRKIDVLNQLLPLLLTKDQINALLPAIEKARARQKAILQDEDAELAKLDPEVTEVLNKAIDKKIYPTHDFLDRIAAKTKEMSIKRSLALSQMLTDVSKVVDSTLDDGQKKVMENSFASKFVDPSKKPEDLTSAMKRGFFIERVFLDPYTRELLIAMAEKAN